MKLQLQLYPVQKVWPTLFFKTHFYITPPFICRAFQIVCSLRVLNQTFPSSYHNSSHVCYKSFPSHSPNDTCSLPNPRATSAPLSSALFSPQTQCEGPSLTATQCIQLQSCTLLRYDRTDEYVVICLNPSHPVLSTGETSMSCRFLAWLTLQPWRWSWCVPLKRWFTMQCYIPEERPPHSLQLVHHNLMGQYDMQQVGGLLPSVNLLLIPTITCQHWRHTFCFSKQMKATRQPNLIPTV
jgi:hypothetical protein